MDLLSGRLRRLGLLTAVVAFGALWGQSPSALVFVPGLWAVVWLSRTRWEAWWLVCVYQLCAARSLLLGTVRFFDISYAEAFALLSLGAAIASAPYALAWCSHARRVERSEVLLRVAFVFALTALPPLSAFSVASPWPAAGLWFPGARWFGVVALIAVAAWLRADGSAPAIMHRSQVALSATCIIYVIGLYVGRAVPAPGVESVSTSFVSSRGDLEDFGHQWDVAQASIKAARRSNQPVVVLPEGTAGLWQKPMQRLWLPTAEALRTQRRTAVVGATLERADGSLEAAAIVLGASNDVYRQRVPVPFAMWRPWSTAGHFPSNFAGTGVVPSPAGVLGILICWEVGSSWAVLRSVAQGADVLVVLANTAWLHGTGASNTQRQILHGWGSLFALPTVLALNE